MLPHILAWLVTVTLSAAEANHYMPAGKNHWPMVIAWSVGNNLPRHTPMPVIAVYAHTAEWLTNGKLRARMKDPHLQKRFVDEYEKISKLKNWWRELQKPHLRLDGCNPVEHLKNVPEEICPD